MHRLLPSAMLGALVALALVLLMHALLAGEPGRLHPPTTPVVLGRTQRVPPPPPRPPPPTPPQPPRPMPAGPAAVASPESTPRPAFELPAGPLGARLPAGGPVLDWQGLRSGPAIPMHRPLPPYPREAAMDGREGWVRLEMVVREDGSVTDVRVIAADPRGVFDRHARRAAAAWRFAPARVDGQPVRSTVVQTIVFEMQAEEPR